jgi:hypothetical protein
MLTVEYTYVFTDRWLCNVSRRIYYVFTYRWLCNVKRRIYVRVHVQVAM